MVVAVGLIGSQLSSVQPSALASAPTDEGAMCRNLVRGPNAHLQSSPQADSLVAVVEAAEVSSCDARESRPFSHGPLETMLHPDQQSQYV